MHLLLSRYPAKNSDAGTLGGGVAEHGIKPGWNGYTAANVTTDN